VGIYDRDYYRQGGSGFQLRAPRTAVVTIILINVAVFIAELATRETGFVQNALACHASSLAKPWMWWQFITYGFVHDPWNVQHIIFNMLGLFFLGRDVEEWYGTREFVRLYLAATAVGGIVWAAVTRSMYDSSPPMNGASGAVSAVILLYALLFPRRTLLVMFVLPLPAWLVGALGIAIDILGTMGRGDPRVAYICHLGGAGFALTYFYLHWNLGNVVRPAVTWIKNRSRPPLKVFKPDDGPEHVTEEEVDRILTKIHREGEKSLTAKERRVMEKASREARRRRES
jgi:membrane associated rhomboid family serine protease